jgi:phospholipid transport system substrate-binding protein
MNPPWKTLAQRFLALVLMLLPLAYASPASADPQAYLEAQHTRIFALLRQPASAQRDSQISSILDQMIDYGDLARRTFGSPCPEAIPSCTNHWATLTDAQRAEVTGLLQKLVAKNYRKNLIKTLDYSVAYKGMQPGEGAVRVRTEATNKLQPRDEPVQIDYIIVGSEGTYRVVDILTEGSSLTKNYYDQFHRMLTNPDQGYAYIVKKLSDKIAQTN